jgi:hypothetical protein
VIGREQLYGRSELGLISNGDGGWIEKDSTEIHKDTGAQAHL